MPGRDTLRSLRRSAPRNRLSISTCVCSRRASAFESGNADHCVVAAMVEITRQCDRHVRGVLKLGEPHLPETVGQTPLHRAYHEMAAAIRRPGRDDALQLLLVGHVDEVL